MLMSPDNGFRKPDPALRITVGLDIGTGAPLIYYALGQTSEYECVCMCVSVSVHAGF